MDEHDHEPPVHSHVHLKAGGTSTGVGQLPLAINVQTFPGSAQAPEGTSVAV